MATSFMTSRRQHSVRTRPTGRMRRCTSSWTTLSDRQHPTRRLYGRTIWESIMFAFMNGEVRWRLTRRRCLLIFALYEKKCNWWHVPQCRALILAIIFLLSNDLAKCDVNDVLWHIYGVCPPDIVAICIVEWHWILLYECLSLIDVCTYVRIGRTGEDY